MSQKRFLNEQRNRKLNRTTEQSNDNESMIENMNLYNQRGEQQRQHAMLRKSLRELRTKQTQEKTTTSR